MTATLSNYGLVLAALCIWREARGETDAARRGVWHVIVNRAFDARHRWPSTIAEVVLQPKQFSSFNANDPNASKLPQLADEAFAQCCAIVDSQTEDPTGGANAYHSIPEGQKLPSWADPNKLTCRIGAFSFYKL